ncbi:MAG: glutamate mutase L [Anaerolineae bacterium]
MADAKIASILAADCGALVTKVALIDRTEGVYRFVALAKTASTHGPPWGDVTLGIVEAIKQLERTTGRELLSPMGTPLVPHISSQEGVDAFAAVISAGEPLHILLAGLTKAVSLQATRRAIAATYAVIDHQFALDDRLHEQGIEHRITAIRQAPSDLILLVGGSEGGAGAPVINLAQTISMALRVLPAGSRPHIIYAGNTALRAQLAEMFGGLADFKPVNNVAPAPHQEDLSGLQAELDILYLQRKMSQIPGVNALSKWSGNRITTTARSFAQTVWYIGQSYNITALGVNVGGNSTTVAAKRGEFQHSLIRSDIGAGNCLPALLQESSAENICRWLPFEFSAAEAKNYLHNKSLYPQTVPQTLPELHLELAVAREVMRLASAQARRTWPTAGNRRGERLNWDLIIGAGESLTNLPHPAPAVLALLDGLEPAGILSLAVDSHSLTGMLGGIAAVEPLAAAQVAGYDALLTLGAVVAPVGVGRPGETALKFKMVYEDGRRIETIKIPFGTIQVIPLESHEKATLEIRPTRNFSMQPSGRAAGSGVAAVVRGGVLGVIIDTRGRPIRQAKTEADRRRQMEGWLQKLGFEGDNPQTETDGNTGHGASN